MKKSIQSKLTSISLEKRATELIKRSEYTDKLKELGTKFKFKCFSLK